MATLTREELYALVWAEPTAKIAARYGMSDRGLGKLCAREDIPVPPRGWWAKKAAGKRPKHSSLPPIKGGQHAHFTFTGPRPAPTPAEAVADPPEILFERDPANEIAVDPNARITRPMVRDTGIALRKATPDFDSIRRSPRAVLTFASHATRFSVRC